MSTQSLQIIHSEDEIKLLCNVKEKSSISSKPGLLICLCSVLGIILSRLESDYVGAILVTARVCTQV